MYKYNFPSETLLEISVPEFLRCTYYSIFGILKKGATQVYGNRARTKRYKLGRRVLNFKVQ